MKYIYVEAPTVRRLAIAVNEFADRGYECDGDVVCLRHFAFATIDSNERTGLLVQRMVSSLGEE